MNLQGALCLGSKGVVSIVGAGGKTSLMYALARELVSSGRRVLTTTTTRIFMPGGDRSSATIISDVAGEIMAQAEVLLEDHSHLTAGATFLKDQNKLNGLKPSVIEDILHSALFDFIIIEADGAARRSLKVCAPHEPVVPSFSDRIVALAGLDAVAKPLTGTWVFRSALFSLITGLRSGQNITESSIASAMVHDISTLANTREESMKIAFLNKADNEQAQRAGERIAVFLEKESGEIYDRIIIGTLKPEPAIFNMINL
jgi:probable selenium-dependent hydroxylase accessory protein YqeC